MQNKRPRNILLHKYKKANNNNDILWVIFLFVYLVYLYLYICLF